MFEYVDLTLPALLPAIGFSNILFATAVGAPVEIVSVSVTLVFCFGKEIVKNVLESMQKKGKKPSKHQKIVLLAKSKLNSIKIYNI